jgi:hypothetical protein
MPKWAKIIFRTVGIVNAACALLGLLFLFDTTRGVWISKLAPNPQTSPSFRQAFFTMAFIQLVFISVLIFTAIRFIQVRLSAVHVYSFTVLFLFAYDMAVSRIWRMGGTIAMSVAAATGISSATVVFEFAFLVPFLYPVVSLVLVEALKFRYGTSQPYPHISDKTITYVP